MLLQSNLVIPLRTAQKTNNNNATSEKHFFVFFPNIRKPMHFIKCRNTSDQIRASSEIQTTQIRRFDIVKPPTAAA